MAYPKERIQMNPDSFVVSKVLSYSSSFNGSL
jgi:hypothetical protein